VGTESTPIDAAAAEATATGPNMYSAIVRILADNWQREADGIAARNLGEQGEGIAWAFQQCAGQLRGLCDVAEKKS
jgi:hypothetical protein